MKNIKVTVEAGSMAHNDAELIKDDGDSSHLRCRSKFQGNQGLAFPGSSSFEPTPEDLLQIINPPYSHSAGLRFQTKRREGIK